MTTIFTPDARSKAVRFKTQCGCCGKALPRDRWTLDEKANLCDDCGMAPIIDEAAALTATDVLELMKRAKEKLAQQVVYDPIGWMQGMNFDPEPEPTPEISTSEAIEKLLKGE